MLHYTLVESVLFKLCSLMQMKELGQISRWECTHEVGRELHYELKPSSSVCPSLFHVNGLARPCISRGLGFDVRRRGIIHNPNRGRAWYYCHLSACEVESAKFGSDPHGRIYIVCTICTVDLLPIAILLDGQVTCHRIERPTCAIANYDVASPRER